MTIKEMRKAAGMTQQQFAELLRIPKRTLQDWEYEKAKTPEYTEFLIEYYLRHEEHIK